MTNNVYGINTKLVGVSFANTDGSKRQSLINGLPDDAVLTILHEPDNPYDKNCHSVWHGGHCLGNLSKDLAKDLVSKKQAGEKIIGIKEWKRTGGQSYTSGLNILIEMDECRESK